MSGSTADQHRRLADLVERVDEDGVLIDDVETDLAYDGELRATISLEIDDVPETTVDAVSDLDESAGKKTEAVADAAATPETVDQEDVDVPSESDVAPADVDDDQDETSDGAVCSECGESHDDGACWDEQEDEEDDFDPDEAADRLQEAEDRSVGEDYIGTESGLRDELEEFEAEQAEEDESEPDPDTPAGRVLETLREEGELAGTEIKTIAEVGNVYNVISKLDDEGLIAKRDDPDDGRRTLYRPAEMDVDEGDQDGDNGPVWNGRHPEEIVADSSLPARVVLDDILEAIGDAPTVIEAAKTLDVDVDNLEPVAWELTLKKPDSLEVVDEADNQIETIHEVADEQ